MNATASTWPVFVRLIRHIRPPTSWLVTGIALSSLSALAGIGLMGLSGSFLTAMGLAGVSGVSLNYFTPAALIRGAAIIRTASRYAERLINHDVTLRGVSRIRVGLFSRLLPLAPARTGFLGHAELFSRLRADVDRLEHALLAVLTPVVVALIVIPCVTVILALYCWPVALCSLFWVVLAGVLLPVILSRRSAAGAAKVLAMEAQLRCLTSDALLAAADLKIFGAQERQAQRIAVLTQAHGRERAQLDRLQGLGGALLAVSAHIAVLCTLLIGGWALLQGQLSATVWVALILLTLAQFDVVAPLPEALSQWQSTAVAAQRVFALIDAEPALDDAVSAQAAGLSGSAAAHSIQFKDVFLRYGDARPWALAGLTFDLPAGQRVAIRGASGAGKSSIIQALLRFYPFQRGAILLGGRPVEDFTGDCVRALFAVVEQRTTIFNGSVLDNLLVARPDASLAQVHAALASAQLTAFVAGLPDGLNSCLGEQGMLLSGGEARRLSIARALLADRPVLLLDEPTEGLDAETAHAVLQGLAAVMQGRTVILITHSTDDALLSLFDHRWTMSAGRLLTCEDRSNQ